MKNANIFKPLALVLLSALSACQTYKFADDLAMLGLKEDVSNGTQIGVVTAEHCGNRGPMGFGNIENLSQAITLLQRKHPDLRYLTRVRILQRMHGYAVFERSCWVVRGIGYK